MTDPSDKYLDGAGLSHLFSKLKNKYGEPEAPYTEVEWVESNGKQYVYLDWKPPIATWGFEADFIVRNAFNTTAGAWSASTNMNGYGMVFGTRNAAGVNQCELGSYSSAGCLCIGAANISNHGMITDRTSRQTMKLRGTTLTKPNGTTATLTRISETANKPYSNMCVFAVHNGLRKSGSGTIDQPSSTRIYSLKFYDSDTLECDLVGAIRKRDGVTGFYDKVAEKFYPAPGCTYGDPVGYLGDPRTLEQEATNTIAEAYANNLTDRRMWRITLPTLDKLEDGQKVAVTPMYTVVKSYQTSELSGWDETAENTYVYIKVTLADGSTTEWIPCYYMGTTRLTTHYGSGVPILFTYRENIFTGATDTGAGSAIVRAFYADANYYTDSNTIASPLYYPSAKTGAIGIFANTLAMLDGTGRFQSICTASNGSSATVVDPTKVRNPNGFQVSGQVFLCTTTTAANTNITGTQALWTMYTATLIDARYSFNVTRAAGQLTVYEPIYLVGEIGSDGLFHLDATWWTQTPNVTGKVYVLVGGVYDCTTSNVRFILHEHNPWYVYDGTRLVELDHERISAVQAAVEDAYDLAGSALSAATGAIVFKVTYTVSNGTVTCAAHVHSAGSETTNTYADSCFQWYYNTGSGWTSLGTGKTKAVNVLTDYGGNVKCDFTPPEEE